MGVRANYQREMIPGPGNQGYLQRISKLYDKSQIQSMKVLSTTAEQGGQRTGYGLALIWINMKQQFCAINSSDILF